MQATVHMITALPTYTVKSKNSSLVIARINEHVRAISTYSSRSTNGE